MLVQVSQKPNFEHLATLLRRALAARRLKEGIHVLIHKTAVSIHSRINTRNRVLTQMSINTRFLCIVKR